MKRANRDGIVRCALADHAHKQEFKGHAHWLSCGCDVAKGLRAAQGYGSPGLRWDDGGWVTAPAERVQP